MDTSTPFTDRNAGDPGGVDVWHRLREHLELSRSSSAHEEDAKIREQRLAERARSFRTRLKRPRADLDRQSYLMFNKQQERYGVPLREVAAVERLEHFTPVPNTVPFIRGVIPWRGAILSLVDLGRLFGKPETGIADLQACVIVEQSGRRLALGAYEVEEISAVADTELFPSPDLPEEIEPEWIIGVHDENRLILRVSELLEGISQAQQNESS